METQYASEIHELLKLGDHFADPQISDVPEGLPIVPEVKHELPKPKDPESAQTQAEAAVLENNFNNSLKFVGDTANRFKGWLIYPIIFVFAFVIFYVVLNFSSLVSQVQGWFIKPQTQVVLGTDTHEYYAWISGYYYAVNDSKLLDPNNDIDKDGLSNHDEFIMRTNPTVADSDSDGFADGIEVINGYNPWGAGKMNTEQKKLAENLDAILINNRIGYNISQSRPGSVSGIETISYDLNRPGKLSIPRLNLSVDLIWSKDVASFEKDLSTGVIHYPGTAMPGERGVVYVSGHSSDYLWKKDVMGQVFAKLNFLKPGDDIFIDIYGADGKVYNYRYQVTESRIYKPDDQAQFIDNTGNKLNLSTCWPIGTQTSRYVVTAVQVGL